MKHKAKTKSAESSCKQPHPGNQTYLGMVISAHIIFCGTHCTRWTAIYNLYLRITRREHPQSML